MATTESTTLRVPTALRDQIAQMAAERESTMLDVVTDAVAHLAREQWWAQVHDSLDSWSSDDVIAYRTAAASTEGTLADGCT